VLQREGGRQGVIWKRPGLRWFSRRRCLFAHTAAAIVTRFEGLTDPRIERQRKHNLLDMIVIALCATICGADNWSDVERFGKAKRSWFDRFLSLALLT